MGFFDIFNSKPSNKKLAMKLVSFVYDSVQTDMDEKGIRIEDSIGLISVIIGERCIAFAGEHSIHDHNLEPGEVLLSKKINNVLVGSSATLAWNTLSENSVFGMIWCNLTSKFDIESFPSLQPIFDNFDQSVSNEKWANLSLSVPEKYTPSFLQLKAGYKSRSFVENNIYQGDQYNCLCIAIDALCYILNETRKAIAPQIALTLACEIIYAMAKTAPMTDNRMQTLKLRFNS